MLQQAIKCKRNKKAVSAIIGYVLLVAFAITMGGLIYNWMKSYVPKDALQCPDGVSMFIKEITFCEDQLTLQLKNNGRFDIHGFYIRGAKEGEEVATADLSPNIITGKNLLTNGILFGGTGLAPGDPDTISFNLADYSGENEIKTIEIIPFRNEVIGGKTRIVTCSNAKIREVVPACSSGGTNNCGDGNLDAGEKCDDENTNNGDGCSDLCAIENGYLCDGEPSVCI